MQTNRTDQPGVLQDTQPATGEPIGATVTLPPGATHPESAGAPLEIPPELAAHPRYRVVELVGSGGMGAVYRAEHRLMQRTVALKIINPKLVASTSAVERFRREVQAAARLDHPNIVRAYDAEQAGNLHFLVMEFANGIDLQKELDKRGPLPIREACDYIRQAALGLQHAHENGMVHRDIKPHNLMVVSGRGVSRVSSETTAHHIKILDFGLASLTGETDLNAGATFNNASSLTQAGTVMGTPDYMAPEQGRDARSADIRADIYSLGCTLYTALSGQVPFPGGTAIEKVAAQIDRTPRPIAELRKDIPADLARVLERMMAKDPARRFQTPAEVATALMPFTQSRKPRRRARVIALAAAAAALVLVFGVINVFAGKGRLKVESVVDDVQIVVTKDGQEVEVIDLKSGSLVRRMPSGEYDIKLKGNRTDVALDKTRFIIRRWDEDVVKVILVPVVAEPSREQGKPLPRRKLTPTDELAPRHREAINKGLAYLVRTQHSDGHWEANGEQHFVPMTALAGMALLMEGSTTNSGDYAPSIRRAVEYLLTQAQPTGLIGDPKRKQDSSRYMFGHGYALMFLATVYGQEVPGELRTRLHPVLTKAIDFTAAAKTRNGGWGYVAAEEGNHFDECATTIPQLQSLRAARNAGLNVSRKVLDAEYLRKFTGPTGGVVYTVTAQPSERPALTAAALAAGEFDSGLAAKWISFCQKNIKLDIDRLAFDEFTHYYYAQALYVLGEKGYEKIFPKSKPDEQLTWSKYRAAIFDPLVDKQLADGSWDGRIAGPLYATACYLTVLQLDNAAVPIYQR